MPRAIIEVRSQKSVGSSSGKFGGPDCYVAVQIVPDGVTPLRNLNRIVAEKRGITLKYFGEGYSRSFTNKSMLGQARLAAKKFVRNFNEQLWLAEQKQIEMY